MTNMINLTIEKFGDIGSSIHLESVCELKALVDIIENKEIEVEYSIINNGAILSDVSTESFLKFVDQKNTGLNGTIETQNTCIYVFHPEKYLTEVEILEMVID